MAVNIEFLEDDDSLLKELDKATQERTEVPTLEVVDAAQQSATFDEDIINEIQNEIDDTNKLDELQDVVFDMSLLVPVGVDLLDTVLTSFLPKLYEKTAFSDKERTLIKSLAYRKRKSKNAKETVLPENFEELEAMCEEYETYVESIPLKDAEKKALIIPLNEILKAKGRAMTPQEALIYAALAIGAPRLIPIGVNKYSKKDE